MIVASLSSLFLQTFFPPSAGCGRPSAPVNGSIEEYRSTEEGAEIQFHCDEGYTPNEWNTSQCQDSMWSPDPQLLHCTSLTCKHNILHVRNVLCLFCIYCYCSTYFMFVSFLYILL